MRVKFGGMWIADSEDVTLLHEPGRYPVAYFPVGGISADVLEFSDYTTRHEDLGATSWYTVRAGSQNKHRAAWQHTELHGFAPRWYVPRADVEEQALTIVDFETFCPYKGVCSYYDIGDKSRAAWSYLNAWPEVGAVVGFISFEPGEVEVSLDGKRMRIEPGQSVVPHGIDRNLRPDEVPSGGRL